MTDLRKIIDNILLNFGHNVFLQRRRNKDEVEGQYREADFEQKLERHTVRDMIPSSTYLAGLAAEIPQGVATTVDRVYWFRWDVDPQEGDRIYESDPRYDSQQSTWRIDYAYPFRGVGGRVEYWSCGVTSESPN